MTRVGLLAAALFTVAIVTGCAAPNTSSQSGGAMPADTTAVPVAASKEVTLKTADGWTIVGNQYTPPGTSKGAVVLLHQRNGSARDWQSLCIALQKAGFTVLAIDQRGAGRSTQGPGPTGNDAPWETSGDIAAALDSLKGEGPLGLAGASYGANNALIYAAAHPDQVKGIALFSPGANYNGLDALAPARAYHGPLLLFHAKNDGIASDGPLQIYIASPSSDHTLIVSEGNNHGTALLGPDSIEKTVAFFARVLKP